MKHVFFIVSLCLTFTHVGQTGPGGVGDITSNQVWIDANKLALTDGSNVSQFSDISGNSNNFVQTTVDNQPIYKTNIANGLPVVRFDGVNDEMLTGGISALESPSVTNFIVYNQHSAKNVCFLGADYGSNAHKWLNYGLSNGIVRTIQYSNGSSYVGGTYFDDYSSFNFHSSHIKPTSISFFKEGNLIYTTFGAYEVPTVHNSLTISRYPGSTGTNGFALDGDIAEIIVYNTELNDLERVIVENYLSAKYNKAIPEDYFSFQGTHKMGVIGIGDNGVNNHTVSRGSGILEISNPTSLSSNEYYFIGHTNTTLDLFTASDIPASISTHERWERTWRVDETGDVGFTTLTFDMSGGNGFGIPATYKLLVDNDGDFSNATVLSGTYNSGNQTFSVDVDLASGQYFTISGSPLAPMAIHSIVTGNWNSPTTWDCSCIPTIADTVYVEPTHTVSVDADAYTCDLHVEATAVLKMAVDFDMNVLGDFVIVGALDFTNGQLAMVGDENQFINANGNSVDLYKVLIESQNTSTIFFINGEFILNDKLSPSNGVMTIISGTSFIVNSVSDATTGRVGEISPLFTLQGNITVRRFLPAGTSNERLISTSVVGANLSMWDADIYISGVGFPDGCSYDADGCHYSAKKFHGGSISDEYEIITNPNEPLIPGVGYQLFIGDDLDVFNGATISVTGALNSSANVVVVSPNLGPNWNIVGNPYASPISFLPFDYSHMSNYYYVFDANTDSYQWFYNNNGVTSSSVPELASGNIAMGQGFWVINGGSDPIIFKQSFKADDATFIRGMQVNESIFLELTQEGTTYKNVMNVDFHEDALDGKDSLDMVAFTIGKQRSSSIFINVNDELLAKNYLSKDGRDKVLDISLKILNDDYFTISATNLDNIYNYTNITLVDLATNEVVNLRKSNYTFYAMEDDETRKRFQLILSNESLGSENNSAFGTSTNEGLSITQIGKAIDINSDEFIEGTSQVLLTNLLGQNVLYTENIQIEQGVNMMYLPKELTGVYLVTVKTSNGVITKKIIL
jgi:hypothetical protein